MSAGLSVYEPRITFDGTTTTLTYEVKANFSGWTDSASGITYMPQKVVTAEKAEPQSIEALIWAYAGDGELFGNVTALSAEDGHALKPVENQPPFVIFPLDTALIKSYLLKKYTEDPDKTDFKFPDLVWIEENPTIGIIEKVADDPAWAEGVYCINGLRISGLHNDTTVKISGTTENFDDGAKVADDKYRLPSIATVLADGKNSEGRYTSTINFYADSLAATSGCPKVSRRCRNRAEKG
jgi:hypothetical protein